MRKLLLVIPLLIWLGCEELIEEDTTPPTVIITSPIDGTIVSDSVEITCMSTDDEKVDKVELWVDGISTGIIDETEPYSLKWVTTEIEHGTYTIIVRAYDSNGNTTDSNPIILIVSNQRDYRLFTANFVGEFDSDATTIVFISDSDGHILADTSFQGDASFDLMADKTSDVPPEKINITTIGKVNGNTQISTNLGINKGFNWTWYNPYYYPDVIGVSNYTFTNIPDDFYRVVLSSKGLTNRTSINESDTYSLSHYNNNEDVVIMGLMNDGTVLYKIIENVSVGETQTVDFSDFLQAEQKVINNLTGEDCCLYLGLYGHYEEDSFLGYNRYRLSHGYREGLDWNADLNFIANYPPSFTKFHTGLTVGQYNTPGEKDWYQRTFGDIPESVEKINADINVISSDIDNFEMDITGAYDQWSISASDTTAGLGWGIYVNPGITSGKLPTFPASVNEIYPEINRNGFIINRVGLVDWLCVDNQEEWLEMFFSYDGYYGDICSGSRHVTYWLE